VSIVNDGTKSNEDRLGAVADIKFAVEAQNFRTSDVLIIAGTIRWITWLLRDRVQNYGLTMVIKHSRHAKYEWKSSDMQLNRVWDLYTQWRLPHIDNKYIVIEDLIVNIGIVVDIDNQTPFYKSMI